VIPCDVILCDVMLPTAAAAAIIPTAMPNGVQ